MAVPETITAMQRKTIVSLALQDAKDPCFNLGGRYAPHAPQQIAGGGSGRRQRLKSAPPNPRSAEKGIPPNEQDEKNKSFAKTLQKLRFAFEEGKKFMQSENMA
ncbi:hypothetical protein CAPTEDRAFT_193808 [Capitella teleta]|uniref:Uncharacterized protein n=1 Tax=Capitella teleta TaxID=283909 RepID=R7T6B4_CAPTE|nr:hypothetical protein CAPTEDRAFT_193808 [Capitella teleta]|eukprot:ELT89089.1 hypothetical protein CAPTEDRAFT_193808 [Capitella teleta]